jgi:hypothetical protein
MFQVIDELSHIAFGYLSAYFEFLADFFDNGGFGGSGFEKLKNLRTNQVEVEHLPLLNVQDNASILTMRAANAF